MKTRLLIFMGAFGVLMVSFQNCAKVSLEEEPSQKVINIFKGKMKLCLDGDLALDTLESATVYNLNLLNRKSEVVLDSDGDGLSDDEETRYGFDPLKRRSSQDYIDRICFDLAGGRDCSHLPVTCSGVPNMLGVSDCDYKILGLDVLHAHPDQGLDSDKDGVTDLIEILRGTLPNEKDDLNDLDHDLVRNFEELARGSNVSFHDESFESRYEVKTAVEKTGGDPDCTGGESWTVKVDSLPQIEAPAVTDDLDSARPPGGLSFTRGKDTNTAVVILKLRPRPGETGNAKIFFRPLILGPALVNLDGTLSDFTPAGEVEP